MGNKPSTPERTQGGSVVIRDGRSGKGQPRPQRPTSAPVGTSMPDIAMSPNPGNQYNGPPNQFNGSQRLYNGPNDPYKSGPSTGYTTQDPNYREPPMMMDPNFSLRVRDKDNHAISGRHYRMDKKYTSHPDLPSTDSGDGGQYDFSYLPRGFPEEIPAEDLQMYMATINKVTTIWPEYEPIRKVEIKGLSPAVRTTLQLILNRLSEQHESLKELAERQQYYRQEMTKLNEEQESNRRSMRKKDNEIRELKEDVQLLRSELLKIGHDGRLPFKHSISMDLDDSLDTTTPRSGTPDFRQRTFSNNSSPNQDDARRRLRQKEKDGIMKATPLLQAEGSMDEVRRVVRNHSQRVGGEPHPRGVRRTDSENSRMEIQRLQAALDRERRENEILRERTSFTPSPGLSSVPSVYNKRVITLDEYKDRYHRLEAMALGKVKKTISHHLSHTNMNRQQQFICAIIQRSYDVSYSTAMQLKDIFKSLISNPVNVDVFTTKSNHRHGSLANQIKALETFKPGQGINNNNISKLAKKTQASEELPEALLNQINNFLESMSDVTNILDLVQNVIDSLRTDYVDCTTASLLNQSDFSQFIDDCCRLCWQMCIPERQLYVCSNDRWRYEERYHVTDDNKVVTNARIEYYLWPILFSRLSGGEVLYKGRVAIKI